MSRLWWAGRHSRPYVQSVCIVSGRVARLPIRRSHTQMIRLGWKPGPEAAALDGPVVVSATRFVYSRLAYLPFVSFYAWRLRHRWGSRPGSVGLLVGSKPLRSTTYSISVWRSEDDLKAFLRAPDHVPLVRRFKPRLEASTSATWRTESFDVTEAWAEAARRLAEPRIASEAKAAV